MKPREEKHFDMKQHTFRTLTMLSLLALVTAGSVIAQSSRSKARTIPFSFTVGEKTLPAGTYTVEPIGRNSNTAWLVRSEDGRDVVIVNTSAVQSYETQEKGKLVFRQYGDRYFLSQIWTAGTNSGRELRRPRAETELAKNTTERHTVVLAIGSME